MRTKAFFILIAIAATLFAAAPRVSLAGPKITGSISGQFNEYTHNNASVSKLNEYGGMPEDFSLSNFDAMYKSNRIRMGFSLTDPGNDAAEVGFCFHEYKDRIAFLAGQVKTPHYMGFNGTTPVETLRDKAFYTIKLYPYQKNRFTLSYSQEDKVGRLDITPATDRSLGLYSYSPIGQRDRKIEGEWAGKGMGLLFNVGALGRKFYHNSYAREEMGIDVNVRTNPVKKHFAEVSYAFNSLAPEANNTGAKLELSNLDLTLVGAVSNRLTVDTAVAIHERDNEDTTSGYGEKKTSFQIGSDYSAGSLDIAVSYDNTSKEMTNTGVYNTVTTGYTYIPARTLDSETLGLGLDYRYSIFKLKFDYKNTHFDSDAIDAMYNDFNYSNLPGESMKRNLVLSTRGLKKFGLTTYLKETKNSRAVSSFGSDYNKTRTSGAASYWVYSPSTTFTFDVFDMNWGSTALTSNRGTSLSMNVFQSTRIMNLGAAFTLSEKDVLSAGIGRSKSEFTNRFVDGTGAATNVNSNAVWGRCMSLALSHKVDSRTSLDASFTAGRYDETIDSAFDGNTRILSLKATRKF